jgi:hypothetical protein
MSIFCINAALGLIWVGRRCLVPLHVNSNLFLIWIKLKFSKFSSTILYGKFNRTRISNKQKIHSAIVDRPVDTKQKKLNAPPITECSSIIYKVLDFNSGASF